MRVSVRNRELGGWMGGGGGVHLFLCACMHSRVTHNFPVLQNLEQKTGARFQTSRQQKGKLIIYARNGDVMKRALDAIKPFREASEQKFVGVSEVLKAKRLIMRAPEKSKKEEKPVEFKFSETWASQDDALKAVRARKDEAHESRDKPKGKEKDSQASVKRPTASQWEHEQISCALKEVRAKRAKERREKEEEERAGKKKCELVGV